MIAVLRKDLFRLEKILERLSEESGEVAVFYAKNSRRVEEEIEAMNKYMKKSPEFKEFEKEKHRIIERYAYRDDEGNIIRYNSRTKEVDPQGDMISADETNEGFQSEMKLLKEEYRDALEERQRLEQEFREEYLESYVDLDLATIDFQKLPEEIRKDSKAMDVLGYLVEVNDTDELTGKEYKALMPWIET